MESFQTGMILNLDEAAAVAKVSTVSARRLVATDWRPFSFKIGSRHKVSRHGLETWIENQIELRNSGMVREEHSDERR